MTDLWQQAVVSAERALRGDDAARLSASEAAVALRGDPDPLRRPALGRDLAYLTSLLEALRLNEESRALLENVVSRLHWDPKSLSLPGDVRNELAVILADRGFVTAAVTVLSPAVTLRAKDEDQDGTATRNLANLAAVKLRLGDLAGATSAAEQVLDSSTRDDSSKSNWKSSCWRSRCWRRPPADRAVMPKRTNWCTASPARPGSW